MRLTPSAAEMTLAKYHADRYPQLRPKEKRATVVRYAHFLRDLMAKSPGFALPLPCECTISGDSESPVFSVPESLNRKAESPSLLAPLLAWFWASSSRTERFRFLAALGGGASPLRSWNARDLERAALDILHIGWNQDVKNAAAGRAGYRFEHQSGFAVWRRDDTAFDPALSELLPDPDQAFVGARICKPGSRNHTARVVLAGKTFLLKRYNCRGLLYRLQNALRRSRAVRNWVLMHHFLLRGVPVPQPCLCLEERRARLLGRSYILMDFGRGETLRQSWPVLDHAARKTLIALLSTVLGRMHRSGLLHGDLKWDNILVERDTDVLRVLLIDFDGSRCLRRSSRQLAERDLKRFLRDLRNNDTEGFWERRFMHGWLPWMANC